MQKKNNIELTDFIESKVSVSKITTSKKIFKLMEILSPGDKIIVDSLENLGKSLGQIIRDFGCFDIIRYLCNCD